MPDPSTRLDRLVRERRPDLSWRQIRDAIERGQVTVDGRVQRDPGHAVTARADVTIDRNRPAERRTRAPFAILHEDDHILVIDKPAGVLSIPTAPALGDVEDTILRRAREYVTHTHGRRSYVGMLHRLDRDTSGALAIALSKAAHAAGRDLFKHHRFERQYLALVQGVPEPDHGTIESRISSEYKGGRRRLVAEQQPGLDATTDYIVRERFGRASLLELRLHTGRQHQIRLHLEKLGHPLFGEKVYSHNSGDPNQPPPRLRRSAEASAKAEGSPLQVSRPLGLSRQMLHAWTLAFPHPITGARVSVEAPPPDDFKRLLARLRRM